jgi:hypothetical protein
MIQMLRPQAMRQLTDALDRAVATNPALASARQVLLQPLKMLEAFGQEVPAALGNQPAALERLRLLLQLSAATALETKHAFESPSGHTAGDTPHARPCEGSVIRMGGLVVAGLAAGLVGRRLSEKLGDQLVDVIHGVALAASPAESLARSLQNGLSSDQVAAALDGLGGGSAAATRISAMAPVFLDGCERTRWECLRRLFETVKKQARLDWEGSTSATVVEVQRTRRNQPPVLAVHLSKGEESSALLAALDKKNAVCVLASGHGCVAVPAAHVDKKTGVVTVSLPEQARAGWVGFATREGRRAAIATREEVVKFWEHEAEKKNDCLSGAGVPVEVIAPNDDEGIYPPAPLAAASWGVRILDATIVAEGERSRLTVSLARADEVARVVAEIKGISARITLDLQGSEASVLLPATARPQIRGTVSAFAKNRNDPDDEREVLGPDATAHTEPGAGEGDSSGGDTPGTPPAPGGSGNSTGSGARRRYVAVLRPVFVDGTRIERVSAERASALAKNLANVALVEELPFVRDDELVVTSRLGDVQSPAAATLLERLASLVARTSGLEDATLLALIPPEVAGSRTDFYAAPCDGVTALVLATPEGAEAGITPVIAPMPSKAQRLRIVGRIFRDDIAVTEPLRDELRAAGPGAPFLTPFVAVALDAQGEARSAARIRVMSSSRSGPFATLLPISSDVVSVELRFQPETLALELRAQPEVVFANLASIDGPVINTPVNPKAMVAPIPPFGRPQRGPLPVLARPSGEPTITITDLIPARVQWGANHSRGIRAQIEIEVGRRRADGGFVWTRLDGFGVGRTTQNAALGLERPLPGPGIERLRVAASDGWNVATGEKPLAVAPGALRIRSIEGSQYWLDLAKPSNKDVTWEVWEKDVFEKRTSGPVVGLAAVHPASAAAPLIGPMRPPVVTKIGDVFKVRVEDAGAILRAAFDGEEDFVVVSGPVRA